MLLLPNICDWAEADAHNQAKEAHAHAYCVESMTLTKDKGEGCVEEKAQPVEIPVVNSSAYYDELGAEEPEWPRKCDGEKIFGALLLHAIRDIDVTAAAIELAFMLNSPGEKYAVSGLTTVYQ